MSILLTALVAFGCAKEELAVPETSGNTEVSSGVDMSSINFAIKNGLENWGTKASVVDGFATGDAISVAAFQNTNVCFKDAITKTTTGGWVMSEGNHYYWESYNAEYNGTDALDFCFVYPERDIDKNKSFTYTLGADPAKQKDLLVKYLPDTQAPEDYSAVPVAMDHALSLLAFEVKTTSGSYKVESITVNNTDGFYDTGVYTFGSRWGSLSKANSVKSISSPIKVADVSSIDYTDVNNGDYCFLLPQSVASMGIEVSYSVDKDGTKYTKTKSRTLSSNTFVAGEKYTYKISLDPITAKLATPTNLKASETGTDNITFTWDAVDNADYYILTNEDTGATLESKWTATSYNWPGLSSGTTYTIGVVAVSRDAFYENSDVATKSSATTSEPSSSKKIFEISTYGQNWWTSIKSSLQNALSEIDKETVDIKITYSYNGAGVDGINQEATVIIGYQDENWIGGELFNNTGTKEISLNDQDLEFKIKIDSETMSMLKKCKEIYISYYHQLKVKIEVLY